MRQEKEREGEGELDMFPSENMLSVLSHQIRLELSGAEMLIESRQSSAVRFCLFVLAVLELFQSFSPYNISDI